MTVSDFLFRFLTWFPAFPAALLCLLPMKNQLKHGVFKTVRNTFLILIPLLGVVSLAEAVIGRGYHTFLPVVMVVAFVFYSLGVKADFSKSVSVFVLVCAILGFLENFSNGFDATLHPQSGIENFSPEAAVFQAVITALFALLTWHPVSKYGSVLIDSFHLHGVWYASSLVSLIFMIYNILSVPRHYNTLHINNVLLFYWISMPLLFILLLLLVILFYFIVSGMIKASKIESEKHLLELQKLQFKKQQHYLEATAKERHDFKHAVRTIKTLSEEKKYDELNSFIEQYIEKMPELTVKSYCQIPTINALLNYYKESARLDEIPLSLDVSFPEGKDIRETEVCSILGNILENAINACREIDGYKRFIRLTVKSDYYLFITAVNSFNGEPLLLNGTYISTGHKGSGIGLQSIISVAESLGGRADFSHDGCEFFSNVMLPLQPKE